jgi:hypothetical protein
MKIIFCTENRNNNWTEDFLINEFFNCDYVYEKNLNNINSHKDILVFSSPRYSFDDILNLVKKISPKIIVNLSDEFYGWDFDNFNILGNYCNIYMREYHHKNYNYTENTIHIPLGYTNDLIKYKKNNIKSNDRKITWSLFTNHLNQDRIELISHFKNLKGGFYGKNISKISLSNFYSNSVFSPCGRGHSNLNCYRLYEASFFGSIPIVVGDPDEIKETFFYEDNPPWIFLNSWSDAVDYCEYLLNNMDKLLIIQDNLQIWWNERIFNIKNILNIKLNGEITI